MNRHLTSEQKYGHQYEQPAISRLRFLSSIKKARFSQVHLTPHNNQVSMTKSLKKRDVMKSLSVIQITKRGKRRVGNKCLLKLKSDPEFHQSTSFTSLNGCHHISIVTSHRVWVSDQGNTTGDILHHLKDLCRCRILSNNGLHIGNSKGELIYIGMNCNIKKLSNDMKIATIFIKWSVSTWSPGCVYYSPSTGELLVGIFRWVIGQAK